jgi:hypothetical protein
VLAKVHENVRSELDSRLSLLYRNSLHSSIPLKDFFNFFFGRQLSSYLKSNKQSFASCIGIVKIRDISKDFRSLRAVTKHYLYSMAINLCTIGLDSPTCATCQFVPDETIRRSSTFDVDNLNLFDVSINKENVIERLLFNIVWQI